MPRKAQPEKCTHPRKALKTPSFGHLECGRCDADLTDEKRHFEWRHSERIVLAQGDRVAVSSSPHGSAFQGVFQYAEECPSGIAYAIIEKQRYQSGGTTYEGPAAVRFIRPEYVRRAPGVRDRKRRGEVENGED